MAVSPNSISSQRAVYDRVRRGAKQTADPHAREQIDGAELAVFASARASGESRYTGIESGPFALSSFVSPTNFTDSERALCLQAVAALRRPQDAPADARMQVKVAGDASPKLFAKAVIFHEQFRSCQLKKQARSFVLIDCQTERALVRRPAQVLYYIELPLRSRCVESELPPTASIDEQYARVQRTKPSTGVYRLARVQWFADAGVDSSTGTHYWRQQIADPGNTAFVPLHRLAGRFILCPSPVHPDRFYAAPLPIATNL